MQQTKKVSVKDKLDGNEIDLSLLELTEVPVKELALVPRGTVLDLSNNKLVTLSQSFSTLTHIVKLDLSKNQLKELPVDFGNLKNLRHLDLYSNKLQRLPVSFHLLKELRFLDLKDNPLVPTLAEAAGDCIDHKGCQEAAKKVVKLMTVVYTELEKKRQKEQEEARAHQLAQKQEEDRAKERARLEKRAEKEKRKVDTQKRNPPSVPDKKNEGKKSADMRNEKRAPRRQKPPQTTNAGSSYCSWLFTVLIRLIIVTGLCLCAIYALNWSGPFTLDNAGVVARRSSDKIITFYNQSCTLAAPHLQTIREQWKHFSRFVAENGRDLVLIVWDKTIHYVNVVQHQVIVLWPIVQKRSSEVISLTGDTLAHSWNVILREAPLYYNMLVSKLTELYQSVVSNSGKHA